VTCAVDTLPAKQTAESAVTFVPDAVGELTCAVTVTSGTADPVLKNQTKTIVTRVR
jgi:hypothetical protein